MKNEKKTGRLRHHIFRNRWRYAIGVLTLLIVDWLDMYIPQFIGEVTDGLREHTMDAAGITAVVVRLLLCAAGIAFARFGWRYFIVGTAHRVINGVRKDIFEKLEMLSQRYFNRNKTGDIMACFTNDLEAVEDAIGFCVIAAFDAIVLTCLCLYRMLSYVSVKLTLLTMFPMVIIACYGYFVGKLFDKSFFVKQEAFGKLTDAVQEAVSAERVLKAFVQEDRQCAEFEKVNDANRKANVKISRMRAIFWPVMEALVGFAYVIAIVVGGRYAMTGEITLGRFVTFASYVNMLVWPMLAVGDCITTFSQGLASMRRINRVFAEHPEITDEKADPAITALQGAFSFEDVSFAYESESGNALEHINVSVRPGETFAIMGKTGCGKTTMVSLLTRIYDTTAGTVRLDGRDIREIPLQVLHESIAYVPQDNFLFSETLAENLRFGRTDATQEEIEAACIAADVHDNIMDLPDRYETMLGERGVTLSGGQKQRTSIARALLKDAPILIMDDSLSAVDTDTEDNILRNLKALREGKTTVMIAHRVSTVRNADHILVLEGGKPVEYGTWAELSAIEDGVFARMVLQQQLEKQLAEDNSPASEGGEA